MTTSTKDATRTKPRRTTWRLVAFAALGEGTAMKMWREAREDGGAPSWRRIVEAAVGEEMAARWFARVKTRLGLDWIDARRDARRPTLADLERGPRRVVRIKCEWTAVLADADGAVGILCGSGSTRSAALRSLAEHVGEDGVAVEELLRLVEVVSERAEERRRARRWALAAVE